MDVVLDPARDGRAGRDDLDPCRQAVADPRIALTWLANCLSGLGLTLEAGQIVTTGERRREGVHERIADRNRQLSGQMPGYQPRRQKFWSVRIDQMVPAIDESR